ncbi:hypothetical protein BMT54_10010 [Pasteurellaceae bacterium 15-036681]|nr:hypothetical protein BMT54_10010 [Pasteurellaceae bacterium 15-036681]
MELSLSGRLLLGLLYQGKYYFDFKVSILTMGGECAALEVVEGLNLNTDKPSRKDKSLIDLAYLAQQFEIDGVPKEAMTPEYLLENLATDDFILIEKLISELRKKRQDAGEQPNLAE